MRWYLPDGHPIFWNELRRRMLSLRITSPFQRVLVYGVRGITYAVLFGFCLLFAILSFTNDIDPSLLTDLLVLQMAILVMMCPSLSAWVIAEEREKGTLEVALTLPIPTRTIVLEKFTYILLVALLIFFIFFPGSLPMLLKIPITGTLAYLAAISIVAFTVACGICMGCLFRTSWLASLVAYAVTTFGIVLIIGVYSIVASLTHFEYNGDLSEFMVILPGIMLPVGAGLTVLFLTLAVKALDRLREAKRD